MFVRVRDICACYLTDISHTSTRTAKDMDILSLRLEVMVAAGDPPGPPRGPLFFGGRTGAAVVGRVSPRDSCSC